MIKRIVVRTLFIVVCFLFFVVYLAPANKLVSMIDLPKSVKLYDVRGDLWNGHVGTMDVDKLRLSNINWKLNVFTLFFSKGMTVNIKDPEVLNGSFDVNVLKLNKEIRFQGIKLDSYIEKVLPIVNMPYPLKAEGFVKFYADSMVLDTNGNLQNIDGDAVFSDVLIQHPFDSSNYIDLGTINVNIKGNMKNLVITIAQDSDICSFNGNIKLNNFSRYELEALLKPKSSIPDNVASLISMLGKPGLDGQITLNYKGNI